MGVKRAGCQDTSWFPHLLAVGSTLGNIGLPLFNLGIQVGSLHCRIAMRIKGNNVCKVLGIVQIGHLCVLCYSLGYVHIPGF